MTGVWKLRRVSVPAVILTTIVSVFSSTNPGASAHEFQMFSAINDAGNEVADSAGWTKQVSLDASDNDGLRVDLLKGQKYRLEISGTFVYAANKTATAKPRIADAECAIDPEGQPETAFQWKAERFQGWGTDLLDVNVRNSGGLVNFQWLPVDPYPPLSANGEATCSKVNRYYAEVQPSEWYLNFLVDDRYFLDNSGTLQITVTRGAFSAPRIYEGKGYQCPKWSSEKEMLDPTAKIGGIEHAGLMIDARRHSQEIPDPSAKDMFGNHIIDFNQETGHWGMYTCNWALPDTAYRIVVDGVWKYQKDSGTLALADAECATGSAEYEKTWADKRDHDLPIDAWTDQRYVDDRGTATTADDIDYLDLFMNRKMNFDWKPMYPDPNNPKCAGDADHTYYMDAWISDRTGPILFEVGDWEYYEQDNKGMLCIHIEKAGAKPHSHAAPAKTEEHAISSVTDFTQGLGG